MKKVIGILSTGILVLAMFFNTSLIDNTSNENFNLSSLLTTANATFPEYPWETGEEEEAPSGEYETPEFYSCPEEMEDGETRIWLVIGTVCKWQVVPGYCSPQDPC